MHTNRDLRLAWTMLLGCVTLAGCASETDGTPPSDLQEATAAFNSRDPNDVHEALVDDAVKAANKWSGVTFDHGAVNTGNDGTDQNHDMLVNYYNNAYDYLSVFPEYAGNAVKPSDIPEAHFMRNTDRNSTYVVRSSRAACERSKELIVQATLSAFKNLDGNYPWSYNFFLGHATHIIQDAFSSEHVSRGGNNKHVLFKVCVGDGDPRPAGTCEHDGWTASAPWGGDYITDHSNPNYKAAKNASVGYLYGMARLQKWGRPENRQSDVLEYLTDYFLGRDGATRTISRNPDEWGYFNCDTLPDNDM